MWLWCSHLADGNISSHGRSQLCFQTFWALVTQPASISVGGPKSGSRLTLNTCTLFTKYWSIQIMLLELFRKRMTMIIAKEYLTRDLGTCLFLCVLLCCISKWVSSPVSVCLHDHLGKNWRTDLGALSSSV